jgi:FixJ family two-component response regulator
VTDVVMPGGMNGHELAERLKAFRPDLKVLFISGYTHEAMVRYGVLEAGLFFLQKPFSPYLLIHKVREVLDAPARNKIPDRTPDDWSS